MISLNSIFSKLLLFYSAPYIQNVLVYAQYNDLCYSPWYFNNPRPAPMKCPPGNFFIIYQCCDPPWEGQCCWSIRPELIYVSVAIVLVLIILCLCCIAAFCISRGLQEDKPDKTQTYDIGTQAKMMETRGTQMSTESVNGNTNMQRLRRTMEMNELEDGSWENRDSRRMPLSLPPNHRQFDGYY